MSEKNEEPTDKKIEEAREKGQVAVSRDLARLATLIVVTELVYGTESSWREAISALMNLAVLRIGQPFQPALAEMQVAAGALLLAVFCTCLLVCSSVAVAAYWGQFGVLISPEAVTPQFDKLNPVNGAMQLFSKKKLGEVGITLVKAALIGLVVYIVVRDQLPTIVKLSGGVPKDIYFGFIELTHSVLHIVMGLCLFLGLVDFAMQKFFHIKSLNMSLDDIKREYRESEGDPMVKGERQHLARQLANSAPVKKTEQANAVVVNPTHFAVAMLYDMEAASVPLVLAKGKDETAQAMILRAKECGIPVIRHVWLARTLYATGQPDAPIPKSSYEAVAHVYAVVEEMRASDDLGRVVELENYGDPPAGLMT